MTRAVVRRNAYVDSIALLQISAEVAHINGVTEAALVMATDLNRDVLRDTGLLVDDAVSAGSNDLVIAVCAADESAVRAAIQHADSLLASRRRHESDGATRVLPRSVRSAHRLQRDANLAVVSVPGAYAAGEARQALAEGLNVFLFSDNVALEDEVKLKRQARDQGLLVMGPDCGTAILGGIGLGFANAVRRGRIGLVGASGTGLQEVTSLLHQAGEGVSHAIGTGSRDLSAAVQGITTLQALELLACDPQTEVIVLVSKPASADVAEHVLAAAARTGKRVVACLLGRASEPREGIELAANLYQAARAAASNAESWPSLALEDVPRIRLAPGQRQVRGLFCGGTLCEEARAMLDQVSVEHDLVDFGDDAYTRGRAHPMIDPTLRNQAIVAAGADERIAVLLLDVILGSGSHSDPAGAMIPPVREALALARADGRDLAVLAHVVGTDGDVQGLTQQQAALREAGIRVFASNHHAAVAARRVVEAVPP